MSLYPKIVVAGCGNPLFADDGFGPAVIEEMKNIFLPGDVKSVDAGTGGPDLIFSLLDPASTKKIIIIDIVDFGMNPGTVIKFDFIELFPGNYNKYKGKDLVQSLLLLKEKFEIIIIGCQPKNVPVPLMEIGLSDEVKTAIPKTIRMILNMVGVDYCNLCCFRNISEITTN